MRSNLPFILHRLELGIEESGTDVALAWREWSSVSYLSITAPGSGMASPPVVSFLPAFTAEALAAGAVTAVATATVVGGVLTALPLVTAGAGYTAAPTVGLTGASTTAPAATAELWRVDPVTAARKGTSTARAATARALLHFVDIGHGAIKIFNEIEVGDCIADFRPDAAIDYPGITFTFNGATWVPKPISDRLALSWDAVVQGQRLGRTVLLRKQT